LILAAQTGPAISTGMLRSAVLASSRITNRDDGPRLNEPGETSIENGTRDRMGQSQSAR
jgi:hypothetical protein